MPAATGRGPRLHPLALTPDTPATPTTDYEPPTGKERQSPGGRLVV